MVIEIIARNFWENEKDSDNPRRVSSSSMHYTVWYVEAWTAEIISVQPAPFAFILHRPPLFRWYGQDSTCSFSWPFICSSYIESSFTVLLPVFTSTRFPFHCISMTAERFVYKVKFFKSFLHAQLDSPLSHLHHVSHYSVKNQEENGGWDVCG